MSVCLSVCLFVCLTVCLSVCLSICLSFWLFGCLAVSLSLSEQRCLVVRSLHANGSTFIKLDCLVVRSFARSFIRSFIYFIIHLSFWCTVICCWDVNQCCNVVLSIFGYSLLRCRSLFRSFTVVMLFIVLIVHCCDVIDCFGRSLL